MVKLEWKVNGRTVPSNRIADELGKSIRQAAADKVKTRLLGPLPGPCGGAQYPSREHGSKMNFTFTACCDVLRQRLGRACAGDRRTLN
jgi:hypothetical protein